MNKIKAVIFDLDGTILNTLEDLADSTNYALTKYGFPARSVAEVRDFVGNGIGKLIERAVPNGTGEDIVYEVLESFKIYYNIFQDFCKQLFQCLSGEEVKGY